MHSICVILGLLLLGDSAVGLESLALPVTYNTTALQGDGRVCPTTDRQDIVRGAIITEEHCFRTLLQSQVVPVLRPCGCGSPGWTRIAYLDMTDPSQQCPSNWTLIPSPKRSCARNTGPTICDSVTFSAGGLRYNQVCGRIAAYQVGYPDAFTNGPDNINSYYVDGVSVTHGTRQHIWTFATAPDEMQSDSHTCPCSNTNNPTIDFGMPSFVGNDYFCETGVPPGSVVQSFQFYPDDPLWDGSVCGPTSTCCIFNKPPWFCKQLSQPTTDDLEVRICGSESLADENTPIELLEIYVK